MVSVLWNFVVLAAHTVHMFSVEAISRWGAFVISLILISVFCPWSTMHVTGCDECRWLFIEKQKDFSAIFLLSCTRGMFFVWPRSAATWSEGQSMYMYYLPGSTHDGETEGETKADEGPWVGLNAVEHVLPAVRIAVYADSLRRLHTHIYTSFSFYTNNKLL